MTQDEKWNVKYQKVKDFMESNHRNPSIHDPEERYMYLNWLKQQRKLFNGGALKEDRVEKFRELIELAKENKRVNQYV